MKIHNHHNLYTYTDGGRTPSIMATIREASTTESNQSGGNGYNVVRSTGSQLTPTYTVYKKDPNFQYSMLS